MVRFCTLIAYHDNHFSALVSSDKMSRDIIAPLVDVENELLPLQYIHEVPDFDERLKLLQQYLDMQYIHTDVEGRAQKILCVQRKIN